MRFAAIASIAALLLAASPALAHNEQLFGRELSAREIESVPHLYHTY